MKLVPISPPSPMRKRVTGWCEMIRYSQNQETDWKQVGFQDQVEQDISCMVGCTWLQPYPRHWLYQQLCTSGQ